MKLTTIVMFISFVGVFASETYSQTTKLSLKVTNSTLEELLIKIENQSEFHFFYTGNIDVEKKISGEFRQKKITEILDQIKDEAGIQYEVMGRQIILSPDNSINAIKSISQQNSVTGKVVDVDGLPLPGVTVVVKGTAKGTVTNADGEYSLSGLSETAVLQFSFVGMRTQEVPVKGKTSIDIVMETDAIGIDEVVAIGYGTSRKKDLTGSIASIKLDQTPLTNLPNVNLLDVLKGSMPGFNVGAVTGAGSDPSMIIRGTNSIQASNKPLIVVDGVVYIGSMNEINPMDIASVDVLKDASSTAVYGSLAANGVILITTKRGKTDKPTINLNMTGGFQTYTNKPDMLSPEGYIQLRKDRFLADNPGATYDINSNLAPYELDAYNENHTIDWFDEVTRLAAFQNYGLSVSGLTERSNYYFSGNYMDQEGIVVGDQFKKFTVLSKLESQITDWLRVGLTLNVISKNADGIAADLEKGTINGPYGYLYVHDLGEENPGFENFTNRLERYPQGQTTTFNPLWKTLEYNEDRNQNYRGSTFARINVPWVKGLSYTFSYSLNRWEGHSARFNHEDMFVNTMLLNELIDASGHLVEANGYKRNQGRTDWYMNHLVNYKLTKGDHTVDATLLAERQGWKRFDTEMWSKDFANTGTTVLGVNSLELGNPANFQIDTDFRELYQLAYMARLNYIYKGRYYVSGSIRRDGYSGYAEGHKYGMFRSGALAWTASEEPFIKNNLHFIDNLKFRLSLGENGNPSVGEYSTFPSIGKTDIYIGGQTSKGIYANKLANKSLDWEKTTALNFGIDFAILKNRLSGTIDLYNSNTTDLLLDRAVPIFNGFTSVLDNIGKVNNKGIELQFNSSNIVHGNFQWASNLNFWLNRNKIISLYGKDADGDGIEDDDIARARFIGKSLGAIYTYVMDGIIQIDDIEYMAIYGGQPGDIKFTDLNNDGKIDATNDRKIVGYDRPNFTLTLGNTLSYQNFELYFLFNYMAGGGTKNYYMGNNRYAYHPNALYGGTAGNWLDKEYWTPETPSNSVTRTNYNNSAYGYQFPKTREFVRLQDVSLSYKVPAELLRNTPVAALKVYASGKNLLTFSSWEGLDPESGTTFAGVSSFPVFKIYTFGLNITF
ncbi:MAG: SusC/RagA family TonB-linked outer membrane protein [Draconibacterium sp.]